MEIRLAAVTIDTREPLPLARWWAQTLGWDVMDPDPDGVEVRPSDRTSASLFFVRVGDAKRAKNRLHFDLYPEDHAAAVADLVARGATRADVGQSDDAGWVVLCDPEGNEFCLLEPG
ncbi:hypothetical protein CLV63_10421 [Murinocardiopsis flavida]|uniref:VOC domain-containing protein n=1 Tax=Murinocardiopsis flavida TaxID=645275 RepID=A0A2P8DNK7_9ACTN|nr:VOC family protein [Murinocardiopsis flavida]PSK98797.1 hypothetical protein CLV63_10421 [Murinocardiopsis flavida]